MKNTVCALSAVAAMMNIYSAYANTYQAVQYIADIQNYKYNISNGLINGPNFDFALGTLDDVTLQLEGFAVGQESGLFFPAPSNATVTTTGYIWIFDPAQAAVLGPVTTAIPNNALFPLPDIGAQLDADVTFDLASDIPIFEMYGNSNPILIPLNFSSYIQYKNLYDEEPGDIQDQTFIDEAVLTYTYTPISEPSTLALFASFLLGASLFRRIRAAALSRSSD